MKKTIAIVCSDITQLGGIERVVCNFTDSLIKSGNYSAVIISLNSFDGKPIYELNSNVKLVHIGIKNYGSLIKRIASYFSIVQKISKICEENNINIIMGTMARLNIMLSFVKKAGLIKIACEHEIYNNATFHTSFVRRIIYPKLNALVVLSEKDAKNYTFCKYIKVIPNSLTFIPKNTSNLENKVVMSAGRLQKVKGFDVLIESISLIKDNCGDWKFRIFGEGSEKEFLMHLIEKKGLENFVEIMPITQNIEKEYCNSSIYVLSSKKESFGLVLLEAKSCGLPIVSFDCPNGPAEIVRNGIDGTLVENGNVKALSQAILKLIENPDLRKKYGQEAVKDIGRFSQKHVFEMWENLFKELGEKDVN